LKFESKKFEYYGDLEDETNESFMEKSGKLIVEGELPKNSQNTAWFHC